MAQNLCKSSIYSYITVMSGLIVNVDNKIDGNKGNTTKKLPTPTNNGQQIRSGVKFQIYWY